MQRITKSSSNCVSATTGWVLTALNGAATAALGTGTYYARQAISSFCTRSTESAGTAIVNLLARPLNGEEIKFSVNVNSTFHINTTIDTPYGKFPANFDINMSDTMNASIPLPFTSIGDVMNLLFNTNVTASIESIEQTTADTCREYLPDLATAIGGIATAYALLQTINMAYITYSLNHRKRMEAHEDENRIAIRPTV